MTLRKSKGLRRAPSSQSAERNKLRALLRKASRGDAHAFAEAASYYTSVVSAYHFLSGRADSKERAFRVQQTLTDCWRYLPYTRRVSDFERFLQVQLERCESVQALKLGSPHEALDTLDHKERFLLATRVLEGWSMKSLKLSFRCSQRELSLSLMRLKCKLAGFRCHMLKAQEQFEVLRVSDLLEGEFSEKVSRQIEKELATQYHAHQFKADWLTYRCELATLRPQMLLGEDEQRDMSESFVQQLKLQPMQQPKLSESIINQFTFIRLPSP